MTTMTSDFWDELEELESAEDFLDYFKVDFDRTVVQINRLHIMQRLHDYLFNGDEAVPSETADAYRFYARHTRQAYEDFLDSDAQTEKVLQIYKRNEPHTAFVSLEDFLGA